MISGCIFWGGKPEGVEQLAKDYTHLKGRLAAPPVLDRGNERLWLYLQVEKPVEEKVEIIVAVAENEEKEEILIELEKKLRDTDEPIFIYGTEVKGRWQEYITGIDYDVYAIGYYMPEAKKYAIVITDYGNALADNISWGDFLKAALKAGVKTGTKAVKP